MKKSLLQRSDRIPPSDLVVLRSLNPRTTEHTIHRAVTDAMGVQLDYVRLVRDKLTGQSKGTALVKFMSVPSASAFIRRHHHEAPLEIDGAVFLADYGIEKRPDDWRCACGASNFAHRLACHKCSQERGADAEAGAEDEQLLPGSEDLSPGATSFLLLQGCREAAGEARQTRRCPHVQQVHAVYEGDSPCGFAFIECASQRDATEALSYLRSIKMRVAYGRNLRVLGQKGGNVQYWDQARHLRSFPAIVRTAEPELPAAAQKTGAVLGGKRPTGPPVLASVAAKRVLVQLKQRQLREQVDADTESTGDDEAESEAASTAIDYATNTCRVCGHRVQELDLLERHVQTHHPEARPVWVDRAAERRALYGQPEVAAAGGRDREARAERRPPSRALVSHGSLPEAREPLPPPAVEAGIGAALLKRMGWREGQGLGAAGTGITEPIAVKKRPRKLGLGAPPPAT